MSLAKQKDKAERPQVETKVYSTWEAFVQAKVGQTNELLNQLNQDELRKLIESKK